MKNVLSNGVKRIDRTNTGTLSLFGQSFRLDVSQKFPLLTTKRVYWKGVVEELLFFISGNTDTKILEEKNIAERSCVKSQIIGASYVVIKPIEVKNQFVTITSDISLESFINGKERYNINKSSIFGDEYCAKHLNYTLNLILKAFKNTLKNI